MKKFLCYLEQYTYCKISKSEVLLINLLDGFYLHSTDLMFLEFIKALTNKKFLILHTDEYEKNIDFIKELKLHFLGDCYEQTDEKGFPAMFYMQINTPYNMKHKSEVLTLTENHIIDFLTSMYVFTSHRAYEIFMGTINGKNIKQRKITEDEITTILAMSLKASVSSTIYLYITDREMLNLLCNLIRRKGDSSVFSNIKIISTITLYYTNRASFNFIKLKTLQLEILIDDISVFSSTKERFSDIILSYPISSIKDMNDYSSLVKDPNLIIRPHIIINSLNIDFIKHLYVIEKQEVLEQKHIEEKIKLNMVINSNYFGKVYFFPNWKISLSPIDYKKVIYSKINIEETLTTEILKDNSLWFATWMKKHCRQCVLQYLCPPPSIIEQKFKNILFCQNTSY